MTWLDQLLMDDAFVLLLAKSSSEIVDLNGLEDANIRLMSFLTGCFFLAVGASIGSFLNVVVYRWPRQMSLSDPPSMCPQCRTPIERRDNIPVLGWLLLRGRCRACHAPIPIRYPAVELAVGLLFVGLLFAELLSGGTNLPVFSPYSFAGIVWILWYTKWDLVGLYLFHLVLLTALGALALMHRDGFAPTWKSWRTSLAVRMAALALVLLVFLPHLHPVPFLSPMPTWVERYEWVIPVQESFLSNRSWNLYLSLRGLLSGVIGVGAGYVCGFVLEKAWNFRQTEGQSDSGLTVTLPLCGLFLGWQAAVCIAAGTVVLMAIFWAVTRIVLVPPMSSSENVWLVTLALLLSWSSTHVVWEQTRSALANQIGFLSSSFVRGLW